MIKICPTCGKEFQPHGRQVYCSTDCKPRAEAVERACPVCGKTFVSRKGSVFCSPSCAQDDENRKQRENTVPSNNPAPLYRKIACKDCGCIVWMHIKSFRCDACQAEANKIHNAEYRAAAKAGHSRRIGDYYNCEMCGKPYMLRGSRQRYCKACSTVAIRKNSKEHYKAVFASFTLEERRAKRRPRTRDFDRRVATCRNCGKTFESSMQNRVFCSRECADAYRPTYQQRRAPRPSRSTPSTKTERTCKICGNTFIGKKSECYCSPDCRQVGSKAYSAKWQREYRAKNKHQ